MQDKSMIELKASLPQQMSEAQLAFISKRTPNVFIKTRTGRGGQSFAYVEIGYVMEMLNSLFGFGAWDWEYNVEPYLSYPNTKQIVVTGKLTVRIHSQEGDLKGTIIKTASGGVDVAFKQGTQDPVDLGDNVKGASADALKKAASMIGIAADIYYPNVYTAKEVIKKKQSVNRVVISNEDMSNEVEEEVEKVEMQGTAQERASLLRSIFATAQSLALKNKLKLLGKSDEEKKQIIKEFLKFKNVIINSFSEADKESLYAALRALQEELS